MLLSGPVLSSPHNSSSSHSHPHSPSPSLMSSAVTASTTRSVLRRYQHHISEQPPTAASHKHASSSQSAPSHARPPVHPGHHTTSSLPVQPGNIPSGLVRMRLSQYLAMCEANTPQSEPNRLSLSSKLSTSPLPGSPRITVSNPASPRPPHRPHAPLSPASYSSTSPVLGASPAAMSSVSAIIAALNSQAQRPPVASPLSAQQQLDVAGRVRSLAKAYTELQRQQQHEKERDRMRQTSQRTAHKQKKRAASPAHNSVLAAVPNSRISLRRRHSDSRMHPLPVSVSSQAGSQSPQPARTQRTFPRSSFRRSSRSPSRAYIASLSSLQSRPSRIEPALRIRFRRSCLVRQYSRCHAGSSGVPRNGGVSLGLDWHVVKQQSVRLKRDNARAAEDDDTDEQQEERISRRYPSQNVDEELPRLSERERREALQLEDDTSRDELMRERAELDDIRKSRQSNFCNCKPTRRTREEELEAEEDDDGGSSQVQCCTDSSCPCVRDGIGCHVEGNHYCQCNLSSSSSSSRPPSCGNPHGLFMFDEYSVRKHALDILYPSYDSHSINRSHSRDDSGAAFISTPSSLSPSLSSPSSNVRLGSLSGLRSASFSYHGSAATPVSLLSYSSASGSGGLWDMGGSGSGSGTHTPRALQTRRASRVSPPTSPLFVHSGRSSTGAVMHRATG